MATLVLVLDRLLFTAVSVLGDDSVPLALTIMEPLKEDRRLSAIVIPPESRETKLLSGGNEFLRTIWR